MLSDQMTLGPVALRVHNIEHMYAFYSQALGMRLHDQLADGTCIVGSEHAPLVHLIPDAEARPAPRSAGLYHMALLYPNRAALAAQLAHYANLGLRLDGASDHGVSEALYLHDPEGNGIELYADRPQAEWPISNGQLAMVTDPLDLHALLHDAGELQAPIMGHVHLHVGDLDASRQFYVDTIGFELMQRYGHAAEFVSVAGYHHHLGYNIWRGKHAPPAPANATGLVWWQINLPNADSLTALQDRLRASAIQTRGDDQGALLVRDPAGNQVRIVVAG
jgi:catechol 2,3-dioxygenase